MTSKYVSNLREKLLLIVFAAALVASVLAYLPKAHAATLTNIWAVETNMDASGAGQLYIAFKAGSTGSPGTITVNMSSATVAATQTVNTTNCTNTFSFLPSVTGLPGAPAATGSSSTISVTGATSLTSGTNYCIEFTSATAITNPGSAGVYSYTITDTSDSGTEYYSVLSSGTNNTINVTATVPQSFSLSLGSNSDPLGNLSTGSVTTSTGVTATVSTNAANGLGVWAYDANTGLKSTNASYTIASTSPQSASLQTLAAGTEGFVTNAAYQGGSATGTVPTTTTPFTGTTGKGDGLNTVPAQIASGTGPETGAQIKITESAAISGITKPATDYSDNITIVGAGSF